MTATPKSDPAAPGDGETSAGQDTTGRRLGWFAGLYIVSLAAFAGAVYGLKFLLDWIVFG